MLILIALVLQFFGGALAQPPIEKFSNQLKHHLNGYASNSEVLVWVFFIDKGLETEQTLLKPQSVVSEKSLKRRLKVYNQNSLLDFSDLPVSFEYIEQIQFLGFKLKHKSKWFNAVSGYISAANLNMISNLPFVKQIDLVACFPKVYEQSEKIPLQELSEYKQVTIPKTYFFDYGNSLTQLEQINVPAVHDLGYIGQGVTICVMDAGFDRLSHEVFSSMNIVAAYDFVNNDDDVSDGLDMGRGWHGTKTLSVIGGFKQGKLIGPAFGASFILAKTENTDSETPIEEDNWIAALEWADSIGADITSTSLGYLGYDPPFVGYTWENMDGNTARITIAADLAVKKGIVVFNSAGNEGFDAVHNTLGAPADGDSVIAVGAVTASGIRASFSSVGNTIDGRIKPDIMAMGAGVTLVANSGDTFYTTGSGTSYSCPLAAGVAALILDFNPNLTPLQLRDAMRNTASRSQSPNREYGWGIINALDAINFVTHIELLNLNVKLIGNSVQLAWMTSTETNSRGFSIERSRDNSSFDEVGFVNAAGYSSSIKNYEFVDNPTIAGKYYYRLKQINLDGSFKYSSEVEVTINNLNDFSLWQNYPNPFNPSTKVKYSIPFSSKINLVLYDILGNKIGQIFEGIKDAGIYEITFSANDFSYPLSSGVYFLKLESKNFQKSIKITLAK